MAPVTQGWSWQLDGTSLDPERTNFGYTRSDFVQQFNLNLWQTYKIQRVATSDSRSYSSNKDRGGSYDDPLPDVTGSLSRSYRTEDWSNSYDQYGAINRDVAPTVTTLSQSLADGTRWTTSETDTVNNPAVWKNLGRTEAGTTTTSSWSSDRSWPSLDTEDDAGLFAVFGNDGSYEGNSDSATPIYGGGTFDAPLANPDGGENVSYSFTDLNGAIDPLTDQALDVSVVTTGWTWQSDGTALNPTQTNFWIPKNGIRASLPRVDLWSAYKIQRLDKKVIRAPTAPTSTATEPMTRRSWTSTNSFSRSYREEDWSNSYDNFGRVNPNGVPIVVVDTSNSFTDGYRWATTQTNMSYNKDVWDEVGPHLEVQLQ